MKKDSYITLFILLFSVGIALAQPGYQGRKLSLQGNLLFMPAVTYASYSKAPGILTFNTTGQATVDYVLSKRTCLGLVYHHARTSNIDDDGEDEVSPEKVFSDGVGVYYRIFRKESGNIAPMGRYFQLGGGIIRSQVKENEKALATFNLYALRLGAGKNRILSDRVILSYGWEFTYGFTGFDKFGIATASSYGSDDVQARAEYRVFCHSMLNLKVGLGFLAF